ncbi:unnamed protein product [Linum trigynum]|uniref:Uncharacterized protein n=1 Tax=Linum trigynum TaxID=586398 RepID=A0AAV2EBH0_9ROSI
MTAHSSSLSITTTSTAFHLHYSRSTLQLETHLHDDDDDDMGHCNSVMAAYLDDFFTTQFHMVNELKKKTIKKERRLRRRCQKS